MAVRVDPACDLVSSANLRGRGEQIARASAQVSVQRCMCTVGSLARVTARTRNGRAMAMQARRRVHTCATTDVGAGVGVFVGTDEGSLLGVEVADAGPMRWRASAHANAQMERPRKDATLAAGAMARSECKYVSTLQRGVKAQ
jgi:hypothetical protein